MICICECPMQSLREVQGKWDQFRISKRSCSLGFGWMQFWLFSDDTLVKWGKMFLSPATDLCGPVLPLKLIGKKMYNVFTMEGEGLDLGCEWKGQNTWLAGGQPRCQTAGDWWHLVMGYPLTPLGLHLDSLCHTNLSCQAVGKYSKMPVTGLCLKICYNSAT